MGPTSVLYVSPLYKLLHTKLPSRLAYGWLTYTHISPVHRPPRLRGSLHRVLDNVDIIDPPWEDQCEWHRMTRMTGPDCAVMCNLTNTHTHAQNPYFLLMGSTNVLYVSPLYILLHTKLPSRLAYYSWLTYTHISPVHRPPRLRGSLHGVLDNVDAQVHGYDFLSRWFGTVVSQDQIFLKDSPLAAIKQVSRLPLRFFIITCQQSGLSSFAALATCSTQTIVHMLQLPRFRRIPSSYTSVAVRYAQLPQYPPKPCYIYCNTAVVYQQA